MAIRQCAFCGKALDNKNQTREHVFSKSLYPGSKRTSGLQLMTVPACEGCNRSWAADEEHFRAMLVLAGDPPSKVRKKLWEGPIRRSFAKSYSVQDLIALANSMIPVKTEEGTRYAIFPGDDERVMRVVRKTIRGLCHHHEVLSPVSDSQVEAHVLTPKDIEKIPDWVAAQLTHSHRELDIAQYWYEKLPANEYGFNSVWIIRFFEKVTFFGLVHSAAPN